MPASSLSRRYYCIPALRSQKLICNVSLITYEDFSPICRHGCIRTQYAIAYMLDSLYCLHKIARIGIFPEMVTFSYPGSRRDTEPTSRGLNTVVSNSVPAAILLRVMHEALSALVTCRRYVHHRLPMGCKACSLQCLVIAMHSCVL